MNRLERMARILIPLALLGSLAVNAGLYHFAVGQYADVQEVRLDPTSAARFERANAELAAPSPDAARVVWLGDSRIAQWEPWPPTGGFECIDRGSGGETTAQVLLRLERDVLALRPAAVVIQCGINDLKAIGVLEERADEIVQGCRANLRRLVERLSAENVPTLLLGIFPTGDVSVARRWTVWSPKIEEAVRALNADMASWEIPGVRFLDGEPVLATSGRMRPEYAKDALHLTRAGYEALAPVVEAALRDLLDARRGER